MNSLFKRQLDTVKVTIDNIKPVRMEENFGFFPPLLLLIFIFFYGMLSNRFFLIDHYSPDSYDCLFNQNSSVGQFSSMGRPITMLLVCMLNYIGINLVKSQFYFTVFSIFILSLSAYLLVGTALSCKKDISIYNIALFTVAALLIIYNLFAVELFTFSFILPFSSLAILLVVLSSCILTLDFSIKNIILSVILLTASLFLYQSWGALFIPLTLTFIFCSKNKYSNKELTVINIVLFSVYILSAFINFVYIKLVHPYFYSFTDPRTLKIDLLTNILSILDVQKTVWIKQFSLMSDYTFIIYIFLSLSLFFVFRKSISLNLSRVYLIVPNILFTLIFITYLPHLFTSAVWIVPRAVLAIGSIPGILFLCLSLIIPFRNQNFENYHKIILIMIIFSYAFIIYTSTNQIAIDHLSTNNRDHKEASWIISEITSRENESGVRVSKVAFVFDDYPVWAYDGIRAYGDMNVRALTKPWAQIPLLEFVSGRKFIPVDMNLNVYDKYFKGKNWNHLDSEQIVVVNDVAYIAIY